MAFGFNPPRFESGNSTAPFKRGANEIKQIYFASAEEEQVGNFTLWKDGTSGMVLIQELIDWHDANNNGKIDEGEEVRDTFNLLIFVSKDKSYLEEAFRNYRPDDWELCIFLEDNSSDIFSGTYRNVEQQDITEENGESIVNIKVSACLEPILRKWLNEEYNSFIKILQSVGLDIDLSKKELKQLLETGSLEQTNFAFIKGILGMISKANYFVGFIYVEIGNAILGITKFIRDNSRIQEYRWNPGKNSLDDGKTTVDNSNFTPFLLPFTHEFVDWFSQYPEEGVNQVTDELENQLIAIKSEAKKYFKRLHRLSGVKVAVRKDLKKFMKTYEDLVDDAFENILDSVREIVPMLVINGKKALNVINAFYCGLWNSFIEALLGIIDLIGFLFLGCGKVYEGLGVVYDTSSSFDEILPEVLELLDETYQAVSKTDFKKMFGEIVSGLIRLISNIDFGQMANQFGISLEQVAYYTGAIVGFTIEILLGFVSGGTTTIAGTMNKFGSTGMKAFRFFEVIFDTIFGAAAKAGQISLEVCMEISKTLLDMLKKGASEIKRLIDELIDLVRYGFKTAQEFFEALQSKFDDFVKSIPQNPLYSKSEVEGGWNTIKSVLNDDEFADFGKAVFCNLA